MNKKIGIVTFHRANNYGAVLQNFALIKALQNIATNHEVATIDYRNMYLESPYEKNPFDIASGNLIKTVYYALRRKAIKKNHKRLIYEFDQFRSKYLNMTRSYTEEELRNSPPAFDVYITGSDQVWNSKITGAENDKIFSLAFTRGKKISYAASAGDVDLIGNGTLKSIGELSEISVREKDLQKYLERVLSRSISLVVDPVFLLSRKSWNEYLPPSRLLKDKYIFAYCVSEKSSEVIKISRKIAEEKKYNIVHLDQSLKYGIHGRNMYGAGPMNFVQLIRDAEIIIASSFHAVAFSIIFGKRFIVVPTEKTSARIDCLLEMVGLEDCKVSSYSEFEKKRGLNPTIKKNILEEQTSKSLNYLRSQLSE